jgi:hypothetical protein
MTFRMATMLSALAIADPMGQPMGAELQRATPEAMAEQELNQSTLTASLLCFLEIIARSDVESTAQFFGDQQRYERQIAQFNSLPKEERQRKNEEALREAEAYKSWYPFDLDERLERTRDVYPQLLKVGYDLQISEYRKYLKHDATDYLNNIEDSLPFALAMREGKRIVGQPQFRDQGRRVSLAVEIEYAVPKGVLSGARMKKYYSKGTSYCVVLTKDVHAVMTEYGPNKLLFGELNPATDLAGFRGIKSVTIKCNLICDKRDGSVGMQVGRGQPFTPNNFGSFCLFKYNFRTPELGSITFGNEESETNKPSGGDVQ